MKNYNALDNTDNITVLNRLKGESSETIQADRDKKSHELKGADLFEREKLSKTRPEVYRWPLEQSDI